MNGLQVAKTERMKGVASATKEQPALDAEDRMVQTAYEEGAITGEDAELIRIVRKERGVNAAARALGISASTVSVHLRNARAKLEEFRRAKSQEDARGEFEARCFELFEKGGGVKEAVIKLRRSSDEVKEVYEKYLEVDGAWLVTATTVEKIRNDVNYIVDGEEVKSPERLRKVVSDLMGEHYQLRQFRFPCNVCGREIPPDKNAWKAAKAYLMERGWGHASCHLGQR